MPRNLAAIITAAGASRRMGRHKALLAWRGTTLVAHQVAQLRAAGFGAVVVVVGSQADRVGEAVPATAQVVDNTDWRRGRSSSIMAGAAALAEQPGALDAILVVGVDQPLQPHVLDSLAPHAGAALVEPVDEAGEPGHPVVLGAEHLAALRTLEQRPEGLRSIVRELRPHAVQVRVPGLRDWDLNTPEDYRSAIQAASSASQMRP